MTVAQRPAEITMGPRRERYLLDSERLLGPALMAPAVVYLIRSMRRRSLNERSKP